MPMGSQRVRHDLATEQQLRCKGLPRWLSGKEPACNAGDMGLIPESGRSPAEGNGNPFQHSCLKTSMNREVWRATVHGVANSRTQLSN